MSRKLGIKQARAKPGLANRLMVIHVDVNFVLKVAGEAGRAGRQGQSQLRQALSLGKRYGIPENPIYFAYLKALLTENDESLAGVQALIRAAFDQLASKPQVQKILISLPLMTTSSFSGFLN